ncbi:glycosyltransferase [Micromonospora sp. NPDC049559]|uniref:glycosyltransferase n=1 Tax=Micromonospora sp. NPDC049559 TaxID=3155923 RepID=UPI00342F0260
MQRLRVMRIIARMYVGGPARQVTGLMRGLDPGRFDQRLYAGEPDPREGDYRRLRAGDVPVQPVPSLGGPRATDAVRALAALVAAMREFRPHVVHTHGTTAGALGRMAATGCRVPVRVHTFHGHLLHGYFSVAGTYALTRAERALAVVTPGLVSVGARVRDELLAAGIGRPGQYTVIPPGVSLPPPPPRDAARWMLGLPGSGPVVAYVGRFAPVRRLDRWLAVADQVRRVVPDARFVVCGGGDRQYAVAAAAEARGLDVTFLSWRADVETVYAAADLLLLTSDNEGMPVCVIEAALAGRPAVATDVGGVAEVIRDGETGLLAGRDVAELSRAVLRLLRDDELCRRMGRAARADASRRFCTSRLVADTVDLYDRLTAARAGAARARRPERATRPLRAEPAGAPPSGGPARPPEPSGRAARPSEPIPPVNELVNEGGGRR